MTTKVCSKCKVEKDLGEFGKDKHRKDGMLRMCKVCYAAYRAKARAENPERLKAYLAKYRAENPEKVKAQYVEYRSKNLERLKVYRAKYLAESMEKVRVQQAKYRSKNRERLRVYLAKYRAENPEKIKAWTDKPIVNLTDPYVRSLVKLPNPPQELIELKRIQLRIHREIYKKGDAQS